MNKEQYDTLDGLLYDWGHDNFLVHPQSFADPLLELANELLANAAYKVTRPCPHENVKQRFDTPDSIPTISYWCVDCGEEVSQEPPI